MEEEDDMLELLDEEDMGSDSEASDELELLDESDEASDDDLLELEDLAEESDTSNGFADISESGEGEVVEKPGTSHGSADISESGEDEVVEKPGSSHGSADISESDEGDKVEEPDKEGIVIDIRLLAVAAIAIIAILAGIIFLALPLMADNPPVVSINPSQEGEDLYLSHAGGDKLEQKYLTVLINGAPVPADKYLLLGGGAWPWSEGSVLMVDTSGYKKPATVTLVYKPKSMDHFVYGTSVQPTPTPTPTPEPMITPDQMGPGANVSAVNLSVPTTAGTQALIADKGTGSETANAAVQPAVVPLDTTSSVFMNVQPLNGPAPLSVQCVDQTKGCIRNRVWNFGDNQTSMRRSTVHIFPYPGTYNVTLDVRFCDPDDNPVILPVQSVVVNPFIREDTVSQGSGDAEILAGGKFFFSIKGPGTKIRIGGRDHYLKVGDQVQLTLGSNSAGDVSIVSNAILRCNHENMTLTVNGEIYETGTISVINIDKYLQLETADLTIRVKTGKDGAKGLVSGNSVIDAVKGQQILFKNVGVDSTGKLLFSVKESAGYTFRGGIESYEVITPPPL
jgi:PKD repeat protein